MKGEVVSVGKFFDEATCAFKYNVVIEFEEEPEFKLGEVDL